MKEYFLILDNKNFFLNNCFGKKYFATNVDGNRTYSTFHSVNTLLQKKDKLNQLEGRFVVLWHVTGTKEGLSGITNEILDLIDQMYGTKIVLKVGKSQDSDAISAIKKELSWFDILCDGDSVISFFKENVWDISKCIANLPKRSAEEHQEETFSYLLKLFLPMDVDMQALAILAEQKETARDPDDYLKEMFDDSVDYAQKYNDFKKKADDLAACHAIQEKLGELCGTVQTFLIKLQGQASRKNPLYKELQTYWAGTNYQSFHDWYCALAKCLRNGQ